MAASPQISAVVEAAVVAATTVEGVEASSASLQPVLHCRHGDWDSPAPVCKRAMPPLWGTVMAAGEDATCTPGTSAGSWPAGVEPSAVWILQTELGRTLTWTASPWRSLDTWAMETCWARTLRARMMSTAGTWVTLMEIFKSYRKIFAIVDELIHTYRKSLIKSNFVHSSNEQNCGFQRLQCEITCIFSLGFISVNETPSVFESLFWYSNITLDSGDLWQTFSTVRRFWQNTESMNKKIYK